MSENQEEPKRPRMIELNEDSTPNRSQANSAEGEMTDQVTPRPPLQPTAGRLSTPTAPSKGTLALAQEPNALNC